jgi:MoaA/NifB/PqqE/SkfB family radical SAM enzyme
MCHKWKTPVERREPDEASLEQWQRFLVSLASLCANNKPRIHFAGGEPLARKETIVLCAYANGLEFKTLVATNAYLLDEAMILELKQAGVQVLTISIDGVTARTHDYIRGVPGSYSRVMLALNRIKSVAPGIQVGFSTTISALNMKELPDLVRWSQQSRLVSDITFQAVTLPFSSDADDFWYKDERFSCLWPKEYEVLSSVIDELIGLKSQGVRNNFSVLNPITQFRLFKKYFKNPHEFIKHGECHLDTGTMNVTPAGQIHLCFEKEPIGNIKNDDIETVWFSEKADMVRRGIQQCRKNCQALVNCNFNEEEHYV